MNMEVFLWVTKETEEIAAKRNALTDAETNAVRSAAVMTAAASISCGYL